MARAFRHWRRTISHWRRTFSHWSPGPSGPGLLIALLLAARAYAAPVTLHGLAIQESLDTPSIMGTVLPAPGNVSLSVVVQLLVDPRVFRGSGAAEALTRLDARLAQYQARNLSVVL